MWPFKQKQQKEETRGTGSGFTSDVIAARESYISGNRGVAELTATVQSCISLWEGGLSIADVDGTDLLDVRSLGIAARSLAVRGEALFLIRDEGLIPCSDWDLSTTNAKPKAYRVSISEAGGGRTETALAGEVLHFRIGSDPTAPYFGQAPLRRASLTANLLEIIEGALREVYEFAPLGSQVLPLPESKETTMEALARSFRGQRGRVLMRESVNVMAAGGPAPATDYKPQNLTPDLQASMTTQNLSAARESIFGVFGVLPGLSNPTTTGPLVREAQRHLAQWMLQPIGQFMAEEATDKLGSPVKIDVMRPLQAYDAGGRARALTAVIQALALAKETGVDPEQALKLVDWAD
ncbi:hypothetical protein [Aliiroseovarius sp. 2305UL8-7]|uniref:hypothetical protein n=1 Tax=Aliiroseovarius conchicola TaxID=3121637 RepID=UPI003527AE40